MHQINENMNLYEFEGKQLFKDAGIATPKGVVVRREDDIAVAYNSIGGDVVVKAQVLSGKRGKNGGIVFCRTVEEVETAVAQLFAAEIRNQHVAFVLIEQKIDISSEAYLSITYDSTARQPVLVYSAEGGMDIEDVSEDKIQKIPLSITQETIDTDIPFANELWQCFLQNDCRVAEINPLVTTSAGEHVAADAKIALDDDAFYRHEEWSTFEPRTMMGRPPTEREIAVQEIDKGEKYYQGTAGKYIEMDGDIAIIFSGGGASIAAMDALMQAGLKPANYTEYSGNPPREKVAALAKIVLQKPGLRGLWMAGAVANFTNVKETFQGIVDALDEVKPAYPIVVRRAGPFDAAGMALLKECAERNDLDIVMFGKEVSVGETVQTLIEKVNA
jgi:succinyl-CoA synthetase beta subunit